MFLFYLKARNYFLLIKVREYDRFVQIRRRKELSRKDRKGRWWLSGQAGNEQHGRLGAGRWSGVMRVPMGWLRVVCAYVCVCVYWRGRGYSRCMEDVFHDRKGHFEPLMSVIPSCSLLRSSTRHLFFSLLSTQEKTHNC